MLLVVAAGIAHASQGDERYAAGDYAGALESFSRELAASQLGPDAAPTFLKMARCHIKLGQPWLAEVRLRRLIHDYPDTPAAAGGVALLDELLRSRSAWQEAVHLAEGFLTQARAATTRVPFSGMIRKVILSIFGFEPQ